MGNEVWNKALSYLPERVREAVRRQGGDGHGVEEIRVRAGGLCTLTVNGRNVSCGIAATERETAEVAERLCEGSLYAHADSIREGVICTPDGIRAGIAGTASPDGKTVRSVRDLTSVCLRLPGRRPGAADAVLPYLRRGESVLVWSLPGMGKTTVLREAVASLAGRSLRRVAVIDTRRELEAGLERDGPLTADLYRGWPRAAGMEAAVRTMSPEIVVCDELGGEEDCAAVERVRQAGVAVLCSVHAGDLRSAAACPPVKKGLFPVLCGIRPEEGAGAADAEEDIADEVPFVPVSSAVCGRRRIEVYRRA